MFSLAQLLGVALIAFNIPILLGCYVVSYIGGRSIIGKIAPLGSAVGFICGLIVLLFGGK